MIYKKYRQLHSLICKAYEEAEEIDLGDEVLQSFPLIDFIRIQSSLLGCLYVDVLGEEAELVFEPDINSADIIDFNNPKE